MIRIAILGGGISGLTAAYELELARKRGAALDWRLYEATDRLGGILQTTRHTTPEGDYILEGGPDAWVTEKPWATELALELGLEDQLIYSNDATRKTYIFTNNELQPIPDRMRLMVPENLDALAALETSPLFSAEAKAAYANELTRASELKQQAPTEDESIAGFVRRHFGEEVLTTLAAPLLSGVFGGDVHKLSVRAVMPQFVAMEREHGSLIAALQAKSRQRTRAPQPIFTTLRNGMASLVDALVAQLPVDRLHLNHSATTVARKDRTWSVHPQDCHPERSAQREVEGPPHFAEASGPLQFNHIILATPVDATRNFLASLHLQAALPLQTAALLPTEASSAILVTFTWPADTARTFTLPPGFGFLVPQSSQPPTPALSSRPEAHAVSRSGETSVFRLASAAGASPFTQPPQPLAESEPRLLACTFVDQKFPHRAPPNARILRAFFGGPSAAALAPQPDATITHAALTQLRNILGHLPDPNFTTIRSLPRSLPQYEVGHLDRIAQLESVIARTPGLHLLGNAYRGIGLPDLIRDARATARSLIPDP